MPSLRPSFGLLAAASSLSACPTPAPPLPFDAGTRDVAPPPSLTTRITDRGSGPVSAAPLFRLAGGFRIEAGAQSAFIASMFRPTGARGAVVRYAAPRSAGPGARDVFLDSGEDGTEFVGPAIPGADSSARGLIAPREARVGMRWEWVLGASVTDRFEVTARTTAMTAFGERTVWTIRREGAAGATESRYIEDIGPLVDAPEMAYVSPRAKGPAWEPEREATQPTPLNGVVVPSPPSRNVQLSSVDLGSSGGTLIILEGDRAEGDVAAGAPAHGVVCLRVVGNDIEYGDTAEARERFEGAACPRLPSGEIWGHGARAAVGPSGPRWVDRSVRVGDRTFTAHGLSIGPRPWTLASEIRDGRVVAVGPLEFRPWDVALAPDETPREGTFVFLPRTGDPFALFPPDARTPDWVAQNARGPFGLGTGTTLMAGLRGNHLLAGQSAQDGAFPLRLLPPLPGTRHVHSDAYGTTVLSVTDDHFVDQVAGPEGVVTHVRLAHLDLRPGQRVVGVARDPEQSVLVFSVLETPTRDGPRATLRGWRVPTTGARTEAWQDGAQDVLHFPIGYDLLVCGSFAEGYRWEDDWELGGRPAARVIEIPGSTCALVVRDFDPTAAVPRRAGDAVPLDFFHAEGVIPRLGETSLAFTMRAWGAAQDAPRVDGARVVPLYTGGAVSTTRIYSDGLLDLGPVAPALGANARAIEDLQAGGLWVAYVTRESEAWTSYVRRLGRLGDEYTVRRGTGEPPAPPTVLCPSPAGGGIARDHLGVFAFSAASGRRALPDAISDPAEGIRVQARLTTNATCGTRLDGRGVACIADDGQRRDRLQAGLVARDPVDPSDTERAWVPLADDHFVVAVGEGVTLFAALNAQTFELTPYEGVTRVLDVSRDATARTWAVVERNGERVVGVFEPTRFVPYAEMGYRAVGPSHAEMASVTRAIALRDGVYLLAGDRLVMTLQPTSP